MTLSGTILWLFAIGVLAFCLLRGKSGGCCGNSGHDDASNESTPDDKKTHGGCCG